jgi:hypothetical protein
MKNYQIFVFILAVIHSQSISIPANELSVVSSFNCEGITLNYSISFNAGVHEVSFFTYPNIFGCNVIAAYYTDISILKKTNSSISGSGGIMRGVNCMSLYNGNDFTCDVTYDISYNCSQPQTPIGKYSPRANLSLV